MLSIWITIHRVFRSVNLSENESNVPNPLLLPRVFSRYTLLHGLHSTHCQNLVETSVFPDDFSLNNSANLSSYASHINSLLFPPVSFSFYLSFFLNTWICANRCVFVHCQCCVCCMLFRPCRGEYPGKLGRAMSGNLVMMKCCLLALVYKDRRRTTLVVRHLPFGIFLGNLSRPRSPNLSCAYNFMRESLSVCPSLRLWGLHAAHQCMLHSV